MRRHSKEKKKIDSELKRCSRAGTEKACRQTGKNLETDRHRVKANKLTSLASGRRDSWGKTVR